MRLIFVAILSAGLLSSCGSAGLATSSDSPTLDVGLPATIDPASTLVLDDDSNSDQYSYQWLSLDMRMVDVVAHVNITKVISTGSAYENTDCVNNTGPGYCFYDLKAEVKEVFKGRLKSKSITINTSADAAYPKKYFLDEMVVFLTWMKDSKGRRNLVEQLENSSRPVKSNVIDKLRRINSRTYIINEDDEKNPYSMAYIKSHFMEADAVVEADVSFKSPRSNDMYNTATELKAKIRKVFKGNLVAGDEIEFKDDLLHRPVREEDLGHQVLYLEGKTALGKTVFEKVSYTEGWIRYGILEKLAKIAN